MASICNSNLISNSNRLSSSITNSSNHSVSSCRGNLASITVRKDTTAIGKKAGIKLEQDSKGQVTVKNIAKNGLFGDTELEIGDIILSVNRKKLSEGQGPDILMKWVHKYNIITISVRKPPTPPPPSSSLSVSDNDNDESTRKRTKIKKKNKKKKTNKSVTAAATTTGKKTVTITAEVNTTSDGTVTNSKSSSKKKPSSSSSLSTSSTIGLVLEIQNGDQLFVKDICKDSVFSTSSSSSSSVESTTSTNLEIGDRILCINDMSFRQYADVGYAYQTMNMARIIITLLVEKVLQPQTNNKKKKATSNKMIPKSSLSSSVSLSSSYGDDDDDDDTSMTSYSDNVDDDNDEFCITSSNGHSSTRSTKKKKSSSSTSKSTNSSKYKFEVQQSDFKIEKYRPVTITVPTAKKGLSSSTLSYRTQRSIGLEFRLVKTDKGDALNTIVEDTNNKNNKDKQTKWVYVHKIEKDSIFKDSSLKEGDKVISINNTDLREPISRKRHSNRSSGSSSSSEEEEEEESLLDIDTRKAYKACLAAKEFITMVVLKDDETVFLEKSFCFDNSMTNLEWKI